MTDINWTEESERYARSFCLEHGIDYEASKAAAAGERPNLPLEDYPVYATPSPYFAR